MTDEQASAPQTLPADRPVSIDAIVEKIEIQTDPLAICGLPTGEEIVFPEHGKSLLHIVMSGQAQVKLQNGAVLELTEGQLVMIPGSQPHSLGLTNVNCSDSPYCTILKWTVEDRNHILSEIAKGASVVLCAYVDISFFGVVSMQSFVDAPIFLDLAAQPSTQQLVPTLIQSLNADEGESCAITRSYINVGITALLVKYFRGIPDADRFPSIAKEPRLQPAIRAMVSEPENRHNVESLAEACFMSRSNFATKFSEVFGMGPMEFLRDIRLRNAAKLLVRHSLPIDAVSRQSGFQSRSAFLRAFRNKFGCSPLSYRQKNASLPPE